MNGHTSQWPAAADYAAAMQDPEHCLIDERLRSATCVLNPMGLPAVRSGQTAAVFRVTIWEHDAAVRFFTAPTDQIDRYRLLSLHLQTHPNPLFVQSEWIPEAAAIGTGVYPAVLMPWVPGVSLSTFVDDAVEDGDGNAIADLAHKWGRAAMTLPHSAIVHADLQHGNVMIDGEGNIRLIDYDGVWVPGLPTRLDEVGHPNYQHPERSELYDVTGTTDVFSAFVIYVSLRAIAADLRLWDKFHNGENLLFVNSDFTDAGRRDCPAWDAIAASPDPAVVELGRTLMTLCRVRMRAIPDLGRLLQDGAASIDTSDVFVPERAGRESGGEWWVNGDADLVDDDSPWADGEAPFVDRAAGQTRAKRRTAPGATDNGPGTTAANPNAARTTGGNTAGTHTSGPVHRPVPPPEPTSARDTALRWIAGIIILLSAIVAVAAATILAMR